jgi:diguanylate cyclase (GGDEF)-like protein
VVINLNAEPSTLGLHWNRVIMNMYWGIVGFTILVGQITYYLEDTTSPWVLGEHMDPDLFFMYMALVLLVLCAEILRKYIQHIFDYVLIVIGFLFAIITMITIGQTIQGLQISLEIPILVSMFYFDQKRLWFAGVLTLFGFLILYVFLGALQSQISINDLVSIAGMIVATSLIGHAVRIRGMELLHSLERAVSSRKDIFVDTITMEYTSKQDHLTGLYNHITFHEYLNILIQQCKINTLSLQLAIVDIDNFKQINDTYGHQHGDEVLRRISALLLDSITMDDLVARYGGEEFALILTGKSPEESFQLMENIRNAIANLDFPQLDHQSVTVSIGMAEYVKELDKDTFFQRADALLYKAKHLGKNMTMSELDKEISYGHQIEV